jgi:hypothetical protein
MGKDGEQRWSYTMQEVEWWGNSLNRKQASAAFMEHL